MTFNPEWLRALIEQIQQVRTLHIVWIGLAMLSMALLLMLITRWGESKPVGKCLLLSVLGHCLLGVYATTISLGQDLPPQPEEPRFTIDRVELAELSDADEQSSQPSAAWDRFVQRAPIESIPIETARPAVPEAPDLRRHPTDTELPHAAPPSDVPLVAAELPTPGQLVRSDVRAQPVDTAPAEQTEATAPQNQAPGKTPLPGNQETRLRPNDQAPQPSVRRRPAEAAGKTPFSDRIIQQPRRLQAEQLSPDAARVDTADAPSRRGGDALNAPAPPESLEGAQGAPSTTTATRPAVPASPSLRRRPGLSGNTGPPLARRAQPRAGALADVPGPSPFPVTANNDRIKPNPAKPRATDSATSTIPFRNRARVPAAYRLRTAPNRSELATRRGGSERSERAVEEALRWLVGHQSPDGRWDPDGFGRNCPDNDRCSGAAGREMRIDGQDRASAGRSSDTGITGLALLALLGAGYTHLEGPYTHSVSRALDWLTSRQADDGSLAGDADSFAYMYCHGMATIAIGEAYGMTGDSRLREPLARAVQFIVDMQDPTSGGWRYKQRGRGDTSVLGWQIMALKSAQRSGMVVPDNTWRQASKFLQSVASGRNGGYASYRATEAVKPAMTAEALASHQLLGRPRTHAASAEAVAYLLRNRPNAESYNLYYWYYGTLSLFHHGGRPWQQWNAAIRDTLVAGQSKRGHSAGSWDPTSYWSPHGGRVYSTTMATLCLEVYYRYLPLYAPAALPPLTRRPGTP